THAPTHFPRHRHEVANNQAAGNPSTDSLPKNSRGPTPLRFPQWPSRMGSESSLEARSQAADVPHRTAIESTPSYLQTAFQASNLIYPHSQNTHPNGHRSRQT